MTKKELKTINTFNHLKNKFKKKIEEWNRKYPEIEFIYNDQLDEINFLDIKFIVVGDHPKDYEKAYNRYFAGPNAFIASHFFKDHQLTDSFYKEILFLYKTPIYAGSMNELNRLYEDFEEVLKETQVFMANFLYGIYNCSPKDLIVTGFGGCTLNTQNKMLINTHTKTRTLPYYFNRLNLFVNKDQHFKNQLFIYRPFDKPRNKPNSQGHFLDDLHSYYKKKRLYSLEEVKEIGRKNRDLFF